MKEADFLCRAHWQEDFEIWCLARINELGARLILQRQQLCNEMQQAYPDVMGLPFYRSRYSLSPRSSKADASLFWLKPTDRTFPVEGYTGGWVQVEGFDPHKGNGYFSLRGIASWASKDGYYFVCEPSKDNAVYQSASFIQTPCLETNQTESVCFSVLELLAKIDLGEDEDESGLDEEAPDGHEVEENGEAPPD